MRSDDFIQISLRCDRFDWCPAQQQPVEKSDNSSSCQSTADENPGAAQQEVHWCFKGQCEVVHQDRQSNEEEQWCADCHDHSPELVQPVENQRDQHAGEIGAGDDGKESRDAFEMRGQRALHKRALHEQVLIEVNHLDVGVVSRERYAGRDEQTLADGQYERNNQDGQTLHDENGTPADAMLDKQPQILTDRDDAYDKDHDGGGHAEAGNGTGFDFFKIDDDS